MTKLVRRAAKAATALVCVLFTAGDVVAQTPPSPPLPPPGMSIGPRGPGGPGAGLPNGGGTQGVQGSQETPAEQQDGPVCTYRENKLELIV